MKIKSILIMLMFLASLISVNVLADNGNQITTDAELDQETQDVVNNDVANNPDLQDIGTTPDRAGYGLKLALEKIRLALTFNKAKKAELALQLAELRVKEARLMAAKNNLGALERAKNEHNKYLALAEKNIQGLDESEKGLKAQAQIEVKLEEEKNQVDDLESSILIKSQGLTDEQRQKLLDLVTSFINQSENFELKFTSKEDAMKIRLKAQGLSEEQIENILENFRNQTMNLTIVNVRERKATHEVNQAQKMYDLASRLIVRVQSLGNETNITEKLKKFELSNTTLDLQVKAKAELDKAKVELDAKQYFQAIEDARDSKKLSALTIASIHGHLKEKQLEKRLEKIEEDKLKELNKTGKEQIKELEKRRKELEKELRERFKEKRENKSNENEENETSNNETEFKAEIGLSTTTVKAEVNGKEEIFTLDTTNKDDVIAKLA